MEVDFFDCRSVHFGLSLGKPLKNVQSRLFLFRREIAAVDHLDNMVQMAMGVFRLVLNRQLERSKSLLADLVDAQTTAWQPERVNSLLDGILIDACVDQGAEHHVAADAASTIEISNTHGDRSGRRVTVGGRIQRYFRVLTSFG